MNLYTEITRRKSTRKFSDEKLDNSFLNEILEKLNTFSKLSNVELKFRLVSETKGMYHVLAPHYLIISGDNQELVEENAGFIGQQLILWLSSNNIGSVWLGKSKAIDNNKNDIITIAFGKSVDSIYRNQKDFKRKELVEITNNVDNDYVKQVRYAPSGINFQPWYFMFKDNKVLVYKEILKAPYRLLYNLCNVDIGIALAHYAIAKKQDNKQFKYLPLKDDKSKKGYILVGEILD